MPYSSKAVGNYFLDLAERDGIELTSMQLQKLIYFAHGWNLAVNSAPLITDTIQAWDYGPVIPKLYQETKFYGSGPIKDRLTEIGFDSSFSKKKRKGRVSLGLKADLQPNIDEDDNDTLAVINKVWEVYSGLSAFDMSRLTHQENSPWTLSRQGKENFNGIEIPDTLIKTHFEELANE